VKEMEIASLNNQINILQGSVTSMHMQLSQKRDDVRRLKNAHNRLMDEITCKISI